MTHDDPSRAVELIGSAVAAFDAANLAWGQFYRQIWITRIEEDRRQADPVREALGEAALSVPAANSTAEIEQFAGALQVAHERMLTFLGSLGAGEAADLRGIAETLWEACEQLNSARP